MPTLRYRAEGDGPGAVRTARTLGYLHGTTSGDWAIAGGWIARAKTLLVDQPILGARLGGADRRHVRGGPADKEQHYARRAGRRSAPGDADLSFATLAYLGASLVHDDRVEEGMVLLDEALAAVAGGEVEDFIVVEEIFCQLFSACEHAQDVRSRRAVDPGRRADRRAPQAAGGARRTAAPTTAASSPPPAAGRRPTTR